VSVPTSQADPSIISNVINGMLQYGTDIHKTFEKQLVQMNAGDQYLVDTLRHGFKLMDWSALAVIIQALLGSDPTLQAGIMAARSVEAQPQTTGQLVSAAPYVVPATQTAPAGPAVYSVNPTTGAITKA
jgi:hypothetical protein